jgi:Na+-translocating ferredoxin:NAD+ oxidoreductase RnfD subunit
MAGHALSVGGRSYPVVLPSIRDARLHVAAVIITVHVLGQVALRFQVSVPQVLAAILTCAVIEVALTFYQSRAIVWPASAMLTGSGVALILRVVGTPDDRWTTYGWEVFAAVAGLSLLSKYVIRYRGGHIFNPSNVGLVVTFVVLGNARVEPLDFWWAPLDPAMLLAYAAIVGGGALIARRLHMLILPVSFWLVLAAAVGVLTASGHCMTTNWSFTPVCGVDYWRLILTSPEVMVFAFFMLTDPRTVPTGRIARAVFAGLVAVTATLFMAPQADEFGTKVGLLASLTVLCAVRPLVDRLFPLPKSEGDNLRALARALLGIGQRSLGRRLAQLGLASATAVALALAVVVAGIPARGYPVVDATEFLKGPSVQIDPASLPAITVSQDVIDFDHTLAGPGIQEVVVTMAQNLELENQALLDRDASMLTAVDHGDRLAQMQDEVSQATATGTATVSHYHFDAINVKLLVPFGMQTGLSLGLVSQGTVVQQTYDASNKLVSQQQSSFALTFAVRPVTAGSTWRSCRLSPPPDPPCRTSCPLKHASATDRPSASWIYAAPLCG